MIERRHTSRATASDLQALGTVLRYLQERDYQFITPTPASHRLVIARPDMARARDLRDVFGWSLPFGEGFLPTTLMAALTEAGLVEAQAEGLRALVRVSSLQGALFLHSAFPPDSEDSVFFGPDTYRFARFLNAQADGRAVGLAVDVGTGSGAGALVVAAAFRPRRLIAADVNPLALRLAAANVHVAGVNAEFARSDGVAAVDGLADLIVANPPYIAGHDEQTYAAGGGLRGARVSLDWALAGAARLAPGGRLLLYTGSAIVRGRDGLRDALCEGLDATRFSLAYEELDPDVFGEQLAAPAYRDVERIAAVGAVITRRA